jgi:hypothetical protein
MLAGDGAAFGGAFLTAEGDAQVVERQPTIGNADVIRDETQHTAEPPDDDEREQFQHALHAPKQRVNQPLPGALGETGGFRGAAHGFLCPSGFTHATVRARSPQKPAFAWA